MVDIYTKVVLTIIAFLLAVQIVVSHSSIALAENGLKKGLDEISQRRVDPLPVVHCTRLAENPVVWSCGK